MKGTTTGYQDLPMVGPNGSFLNNSTGLHGFIIRVEQ
jgi:hypothetical protein